MSAASGTPEPRADALALDVDEIAALPALAGAPAYRAEQVFDWLHARAAADFEAMSNLPLQTRAQLDGCARIPVVEKIRDADGADGSVKSVYRLSDGAVIEAVLMPQGAKRTLCISTQVGCAVGCVFCATGALGLSRHLSAGEILRQIYLTESRLAARQPQSRLTNVVLMGMGEPLHNYEATRRALANLVAPRGRAMSPRRITLSTSGYPERIERLGREGPPVRLAISLSAPTDELRTRLIPLNRKHGLAALLDAGRAYERRTASRVTFEYVLLRGVNDRPDDARRLGRLLRGRRVNLIPLNPHEYSEMQPPTADAVDAFHRLLKEAGVISTVRWSKGREIQAACGQLAARS